MRARASILIVLPGTLIAISCTWGFRPLAAGAVAPAETAARGEARGIGKWLVDLGRDYPLSPLAAPTDVDAELTLLFMSAAARVDPQLAEAHLWQYDLLMALGREAQARDSLAAYLRREPADVPAHMRWVELALGAFQTAEERAEFCRRHLEREGLAAVVRSDLHRRLAEFHWNRAELPQARAEVSAALEDDPLNVQARMLRAQLVETEHLLARQILILLEAAAASPGRADLAQEIGDGLVLLGLPEEADGWHGHAMRLHEGLPPGIPPAGLLLARAEALIGAGRLAEADELARQALEQEPTMVAAHLVRSRIRQRGEAPVEQPDADAVPDEHVTQAAEILRGRLAFQDAQVDRAFAAEVAWFTVRYDRRPVEGERQARLAMTAGPELPVARRALGAALRAQGRLEEAEAELIQAAPTDTWAAVELAWTLAAAGRTEEASERVVATAAQPLTVEQREKLAGLAARLQVDLPPHPAAEEILRKVQEFPSDRLEYPLQPEKYLALSWVMGAAPAGEQPAAELRPGEPWWCTLRLTNVGSFPITLGEGLMLNPEVLCAVRARGDRERISGPTLRISLRQRLYLMPGESLQAAQTLDIGPVRAGMVGTPQIEHAVEVTGVLSPIRLMTDEGQEVWAPTLGGLLAEPLVFRRAALPAGNEDVRALISLSRNGNVSQRGDALERLAMLLAEHQHRGAGRLRYEARRIDAVAVQSAILARAGDADWQVRARLGECLRWIVLDAAANQTATRLVSDPHWLVRGLALRAMADHHPARFSVVLERSSAADPDDWVRQWSSALLARARRAAGDRGAASPAVNRGQDVEGREQAPPTMAPEEAQPSEVRPQDQGPTLLLPDPVPEDRAASPR